MIEKVEFVENLFLKRFRETTHIHKFGWNQIINVSPYLVKVLYFGLGKDKSASLVTKHLKNATTHLRFYAGGFSNVDKTGHARCQLLRARLVLKEVESFWITGTTWSYWTVSRIPVDLKTRKALVGKKSRDSRNLMLSGFQDRTSMFLFITISLRVTFQKITMQPRQILEKDVFQ